MISSFIGCILAFAVVGFVGYKFIQKFIKKYKEQINSTIEEYLSIFESFKKIEDELNKLSVIDEISSKMDEFSSIPSKIDEIMAKLETMTVVTNKKKNK